MICSVAWGDVMSPNFRCTWAQDIRYDVPVPRQMSRTDQNNIGEGGKVNEMQFMKNMLHLQTINRPLFTRQKDSGCYVPQMQHFNVLQYYLDPVSPFHCGYTLWVQMCCICSTLKCCKCRASRPIKCSHYTSLSFPLWLHFVGPDVRFQDQEDP